MIEEAHILCGCVECTYHALGTLHGYTAPPPPPPSAPTHQQLDIRDKILITGISFASDAIMKSISHTETHFPSDLGATLHISCLGAFTNHSKGPIWRVKRYGLICESLFSRALIEGLIQFCTRIVYILTNILLKGYECPWIYDIIIIYL